MIVEHQVTVTMNWCFKGNITYPSPGKRIRNDERLNHWDLLWTLEACLKEESIPDLCGQLSSVVQLSDEKAYRFVIPCLEMPPKGHNNIHAVWWLHPFSQSSATNNFSQELWKDTLQAHMRLVKRSHIWNQAVLMTRLLSSHQGAKPRH